jgi:two-component system sensor histidine kinase AlgZ
MNSPAAENSSVSSFGNTTIVGSSRFEASQLFESSRVFNVCHVGVILRAVLLVLGALAIGVMFAANSLLAWVVQMAVVTAVAFPCLLLWLVLTCTLQGFLFSLSRSWQWAAGAGLGAGSACFGWAGGHYTGLIDQPLLASLCAGAGLGAILTSWLQMRADRLAPAHAAARLAELQSRIQPHFLFNTLNTALCLVRADPPRAEQVLEDLAELFRSALYDERESVTLAEEVDLAKRYLAIEQIRFGDRLRVAWRIDPAANGACLPPLLLQPLVENAVRHGIEPSPEGGKVKITIAVRMGLAVITVTNTVVGVSKPGNGIALRNVRERLHLLHDVAARFRVKSGGNRFHVRVEVPL